MEGRHYEHSFHVSFYPFVFRNMASFMMALLRTMYNLVKTHVTMNNIYKSNLI